MPHDNDPLRPARGIVFGVVGGAIIWILVILAVWGCTTRQQPSVACVVDQVRPWIVQHYADRPEGAVAWVRPSIVIADQSSLKSGTGHGIGYQVRGSYSLLTNTITLWDRLDMSLLTDQSVVAHELAHWVDAMEGRYRPHAGVSRRDDPVYAIQDAWMAAHWPDGVC